MSLQTFDVTKNFGTVRALHAVDLDVPTGSLTALLGPSGCGKTTLLRTIAGFEIPERGRIVLAGKDVTNVRLGARDIGFVFQSYALFPHLDVTANIAFGLSVRGASAAVRAARVEALLELVRLPGYGRRMPHELSGGQRQRVALARALAPNPAYLLLDEPFAALDATVRKDLRRWLRALHDETHVTTLLVTHDADEAMEIADRIVLMHDGRVEQSGSPASLYAEPQTPFVMRFLGDTNEIGSDAERIFVRPHDVRLDGNGAGPHDGTAIDARAERIVDYGSRLHVELRLDDGRTVMAEIPEAEFRDLAIVVGKTYRLRFVRSRTFLQSDSQSDEMEISA